MILINENIDMRRDFIGKIMSLRDVKLKEYSPYDICFFTREDLITCAHPIRVYMDINKDAFEVDYIPLEKIKGDNAEEEVLYSPEAAYEKIKEQVGHRDLERSREPVFQFHYKSDTEEGRKKEIEELLKKREEYLAQAGINLEQRRHQKEWEDALKCGGICLVEKISFSRYLARKSGQPLIDYKYQCPLPLSDVLSIVSDGISDNGFTITADEIKEYFFRHGFLQMKDNELMHPGEKHVEGNTFIANLRGFGHPNGRQVVTPSSREVLCSNLPQLFIETLTSEDKERKQLDFQMDGSGLFHMIVSFYDNGFWTYSFFFHKETGSYQYDLRSLSSPKVILYLQKELNTYEMGLSALLLQYLGNKANCLEEIERKICKLLDFCKVRYDYYSTDNPDFVIAHNILNETVII